jgi:hypothetical protein
MVSLTQVAPMFVYQQCVCLALASIGKYRGAEEALGAVQSDKYRRGDQCLAAVLLYQQWVCLAAGSDWQVQGGGGSPGGSAERQVQVRGLMVVVPRVLSCCADGVYAWRWQPLASTGKLRRPWGQCRATSTGEGADGWQLYMCCCADPYLWLTCVSMLGTGSNWQVQGGKSRGSPGGSAE